MSRKLVLLALLGFLAPSTARADVKPHALCTDGMVLQQRSRVNIWGGADQGETVTVTFRGARATTTADAKGRWLVSLPSGQAGGPFPMTIAGKNKLEYQNVYVGEVWVCSGQSNMQWAVSQCDKSDQESVQQTPPNKLLRLFYVQRIPQAQPVNDVVVQKVDKDGPNWTDADAKTVTPFSATAYFFGRDLQAALKVPVGLIHTSWGGTRAEAWTSRAVLDRHSDYKDEKQPGDRKGKLDPNDAAVLYNGMIHPILNYRIKGAIWYQGESNAGKAYHYRELFPMMIQNWRKDWGQGDFPFYFVQLAPFLDVAKEPRESSWAELREAQLLTLKLPNTGMAVIIDFGHERDIHPTPKRPVGERLSLIARAKTYGENIEYSGPTLRGMRIEGNRAILNFDHVVNGQARVVYDMPARGGLLRRLLGRGRVVTTVNQPNGQLVAKELTPTDGRKNKDGALGFAWRVKEDSSTAAVTGFTICGEDRKFHVAKAEIVGDTVVVSSDAVPSPIAVRYGWSDHPLGNLFNREGLPASPFRTDAFPGVTQK